MKLRLIQFATLVLLLLVTGVFWGTWFSLSRSIEVFTPAAFLEIGKAIIKNLAWPMRLMMPSAILLMLTNLWLYPEKRSKGFFIYAHALALLLATLLITLLVLVPIDNQVKQWTLTSMPENWEQLRYKWEFYHTIRTFTCIGSFVTFLVPGLFCRQAVA